MEPAALEGARQQRAGRVGLGIRKGHARILARPQGRRGRAEAPPTAQNFDCSQVRVFLRRREVPGIRRDLGRGSRSGSTFLPHECAGPTDRNSEGRRLHGNQQLRSRQGRGGADGGPGTTGAGNLSAFIDQGSEFEGKLTFKDTVRIDGSFQGEISSENTLVVGETGSIEATIRSNTVVVSGNVVGNIIAARQIVLHKSARVKGDMTAPSLVIEEGATFNGQLTMDRPEAKSSGSAPLKPIQGGSPQKSD